MKPVLPVSATSRRALYLLGLLAAVKAAGLVLLADAVAGGIAGLAAGGPDWNRVFLLGAAGAVLRSVAVWGQDTVAQRAAAGVKDELRRQLSVRVLADGGTVPGMGSGALSVLLTRGLDGLDNYYSKYLPALVTCAVVPLLVGARILAADWVSAVTIVLTVPLIPVFMILIGLHTEDKTEAAVDALNRLSDNMLELARGLPVLVGLGRARAQTRALRDVADRYRVTTLATLRVAFMSSLALELIATISVALVAVFIGVRLVHGGMPLELGLLALILAPECYQPLRDLGTAHHASEDGLEALNRTNAVLKAPEARPLAVDTGSVELQVRDLTITYEGRPQPAVENLSFTVPAGTIAALTGPSGAGKTSVLEVLAGLRRDGGDTRLAGSVNGIGPASQAWIPQHPVLVEDTVAEEIALYAGFPAAGSGTAGGWDAGESPGRAAARAALEQIHAVHLLDAAAGDLSPGEQRRVAVARALARIAARPEVRILLADEPTAHLDAQSASSVRAALSRLRGTVTVLMVAHDAATAAIADVVIPVETSAAGPQGRVRGKHAAAADPAGMAPAAVPAAGGVEPVHAGVGAGGGAPGTRTAAADQRVHQPLWKNLLVLKPWSKQFVLALVLGTGATMFAVALTALSAWLIVRASEQPPILYLLMAIVGVRFFGIGRALLRYLERLSLHDAVFRATNVLRVRLWNGLLQRPEGWRRVARGSGALERLVGDVDELRDIAPRVVFAPLTGLLTAAGACVVTWLLVPEGLAVQVTLCVVGMVVAPLLALLADSAARAATVNLQARSMSSMARLLTAAQDLEANASSGPVLARQEEFEAAAAKAVRRSAWAQGLANAVTALACSLAALYMLSASQGSHATVAAVVVLVQLALIEPFVAVNGSIQQFTAWRTLGDKVLPDLGSEEVAADDTAEETAARKRFGKVEDLQLTGIRYRYPGAPEDVLTGVDLHVAAGEWVAVTGPSGSGKSTLLGVLLGFLPPRSGSYLINGVPAGTLPPAARRMAWCPQEAHLFDSSLRGNLLLARDRALAPTEAEMIGSLRAVGLGPLFDTLPEGLDTPIGAGGHFLSGGQRQRLAVARALLSEADVVLLDEPTAHLDAEAGAQLMADLKSGLAGKAVVVVTHNPADAAWCEREVSLGAVLMS
ncbi:MULTISPECIES: thiol reductant ABC exporter subunit CydD [unclassified Arthrobacter]|uniref:thiol reductant ABC exporter subunit CydD n=1 Tax=unclassified Arthrobacter TaxID=235627 RepID=UPI0024DF983F|nr:MULTISPECIES: thiol reductant ABC exporter subunit CydD [unclassified Arthrobacter]MCC9145093.1 thiol reductant ABC exporter subunit CydD [Arthrobacter sp. zg-Y919]MDK1276321.1 thiol reductant ABC exporter subunit CydD [Arthrobacter sp. zg.Y919]WIB02075.1 thiol reductant ABC exporter subunit CydD [Arthrobacter sp. zg-Y919]